MKNIILLNYNIDANIKKYSNDVYYFYIDYIKYFFIKINRPINDIIYLNSHVNNNFYHTPIANVKGNFYTNVQKNNYILLKLNLPENDEITIEEILKYQIPVDNIKKDLDRRMWSSLWERKIDYLEYQVSELALNHKSAISSFSYYVGLGENAIMYFNLTDKTGGIAFNQKRIIYPNYSKNFFNPLNLVVDYRVRDIAEYIKSVFWNGKNPINVLKQILDKNIFTNSEYNLLFVRLIYPSNYFDDLQSVLENNTNDDQLIKYIERAEEYRLFLKESFYLITKKAPLMSIDWIIKEH